LKGLNLIKAVIDLKGAKRFKNTEAAGRSASKSPNDINLELSKDPNQVKLLFRKLQMNTAYGQQFGSKPQAEDDFNILKEKSFAKLPISQILKPDARTYLNNWLIINDQDKFTGRIFFTVREMYTVVKNRLADVPTSHDNHGSHSELKIELPRFDKIINGINAERRHQQTLSMSMNKVRPSAKRSKNYLMDGDFKIGSKHREFTPSRLPVNHLCDGPPKNYDAKEVKLRFLAGDKEAVLY